MGDPASLSDQQRQILHRVAAGWTSPHIARRLGLRGNHALLRWALLHAGSGPAEPIE